VFLSIVVIAQQKIPVQFSGIVVTGDSLEPVSFTHIQIRGTNRGTIGNFYGYFSFVARANDTVDFSSVGFKMATFVVPDTLTTDHYTMFQVMHADTIYLSETVIYPWPTPSQFKHAFLTLQIPDDDLERARKNIEMMKIKDYLMTTPMDGSMNYRNYVQNQVSNYYTIGQMPQNNLLNPLSWAAFFDAWKRGEFKKKNPHLKTVYPPDN
jgi:hypothetical protein